MYYDASFSAAQDIFRISHVLGIFSLAVHALAWPNNNYGALLSQAPMCQLLGPKTDSSEGLKLTVDKVRWLDPRLSPYCGKVEITLLYPKIVYDAFMIQKLEAHLYQLIDKKLMQVAML